VPRRAALKKKILDRAHTSSTLFIRIVPRCIII
jgi:hypothetical protein